MTWGSLRALQQATRIEFTAALAAQHTFVRLPSGRWARVLGMPGSNTRHLYGRCYEVVS